MKNALTWNMLIVVKHRESVDVERTDDCLKSFDFIPYAI